MDSISQAALGAAIGEAVLGRRLGRGGMLVGAALGTLPDLDVLVRYADAVDGFTRHRGWSHSLFVLSVASVPIAALLHRRAPRWLARLPERVGSDRGDAPAPRRSADGGESVRGELARDTALDARAGEAPGGRDGERGARDRAGESGRNDAAESADARSPASGADVALSRTGRDTEHMPAGPPVSYGRWLLAVWLILVTHALLDAFTLYGTQLWWPLPVRPVAIGSIFIIDPLYTLPLLVGLVWAWRSRGRAGKLANGAGLAASTAYLGLTLIAQGEARAAADAALERRGVEPERRLVAPFPFSLLWRVVALDGDRYLEGYHSLLDDGDALGFVSMSRGDDLLGAVAGHPPLERLAWFTDSLIAAEARGDALVVSDLRMGVEASYVFEFVVAEREDGRWRAVRSRLEPIEIDLDRLASIVRRTWDETVEVDRGERSTSGDGGEGRGVPTLD